MHGLRWLPGSIKQKVVKRRFRAYCFGTPRSGTTSIAGVFKQNYLAYHEPDYARSIRTVMAYRSSRLSKHDLSAFLTSHDTRIWLELESSNILSHVVSEILETFHDAKILFTIRDCYSWLDSYLNHQVANPIRWRYGIWQEYRDFLFACGGFTHSKHDRPLESRDLYPLDAYLTYWAAVNGEMLDRIPLYRRLLIPTYRIQEYTERIEDFLNLKRGTLDRSHGHLYRVEKPQNVLSQLDSRYLKDRVGHICGAVMARHFPCIRHLGESQASSGMPLLDK